MPTRHHYRALLAAATVGLSLSAAPAETPATRPTTSQTTAPAVPLSSGRRLARGPAGPDVGSLPVNLVRSADGRFAVGTDAGFDQFLWVVNAATGTPVGKLGFDRSRRDKANGLYYGLAAGPDGAIYAAQGAARRVAVIRLDAAGVPTLARTIATRSLDFPAGVSIAGGTLFVTDNDPTRQRDPAVTRPSDVPQNAVESDEAFGRDGAMAAYDAATGKELGRLAFPSVVPGTSSFPLAVAALPNGRVFVTSERDACVYDIDATDPAAMKLTRTIPVGSHPIALLPDAAGRRLFVANAHGDTVSVIDVAAGTVSQTLLLRPEVARDLAGATPTNLALSPDGGRLFVTLGDMNAVAVADVSDAAGPPKLLGYVPAGWYPTGAVASPDGRHLVVCDAKGHAARIPHDEDAKGRLHSPLYDIRGDVIRVDVPDDADEFAASTGTVLDACRLQPQFLNRPNPLASIGRAAGKIKHVIYVVKENRSYDQVLGDLPQGNGDPARCLFGRRVTPNQHALAERFVLLDNFYDSGDVSGDGWTWSTQAQANEYAVRNTPYNYSGRGRNFDFEGQVNDYPTGGFPATRPGGGPMSVDPRFAGGAKPVPDVAESPGGHLWDLAKHAGLTYRNYGFFLTNGVTAGGGHGNAEGGGVSDDALDAGPWSIPDNQPAAAGLRPGGHDLAGVSDVDFRRFDMDFPDSDARATLFQKTGDEKYLDGRHTYGAAKVTSRFAEWNREFQIMLAKDPAGGAVPALMTVRLPCDHTVGLSAGRHTPASMVADNDHAVGQLVEAVSHSAVWASTAIVIIEDDAQNGPDHVDLHRSTCYVVSPWVRRGAVDHAFHNTVSALKTVECLLGLGPMCQYDAAASPILNWTFDGPANLEPFDALPADAALIAETNPERGAAGPAGNEKLAAMQRRAAAMDFAHADRAPADELNRMIWASVRGVDSAMPPTPAGPAPAHAAKADDDD